MLKHISIIRGVQRVVREAAYVGIVSILIIAAYQVVARRFLQPEGDAHMRAVRNALAEYAIMFPGKQLIPRRINLREKPYTFFLFTSPDCPFCVQSAAFHKRLLSEATSHSVPLFVALPEAGEIPAHLSSVGSALAKRVGWLDFNMRVAGTPSVVLVDSNGRVLRVWIGQLGSAAESEVVQAIRDPSHVNVPVRRLESGEGMLNLDELQRKRDMRAVAIISIAERGSFRSEHAAGAINIPFDELAARAGIELRRSDLNVVDCTVAPDGQCWVALRVLKDQGFQTAALDRSSRPGLE